MKKYAEKVYDLINSSSIAKGASIGIFMKGGGLVIAQLFALLVARLFGAEEWGRLSLVILVINFGAILAKLGLDRGLLRFIAEFRGEGNELSAFKAYFGGIKIAAVFTFVITVIAYFLAPIIAVNIFNKPELEGAFRKASFGIPAFVFLQINAESLRGLKKITVYSFLSYMSLYIFGSIIIAILYLVKTISNEVVTAYIISLNITCLISFLWIYKHFNFKYFFDSKNSKPILDKLIKVSFPLLLANSLMFIKGWVDTFMLGIFMDESSIGVYNISLQLAKVVTVALTAVNLISAPLFAEYYGKDDFRGLQEATSQSTRYIFYLSLPILLVYIFFPKIILGIFGEEFKTGSITLIILSIGYFVNAITGSVGYIMQMTGRQVAFQNITIISTLIGIVMNYVLIPKYGILGASISTLSSMVIWNWSCAIFLKVKMNLVTIFNPFRALTGDGTKT